MNINFKALLEKFEIDGKVSNELNAYASQQLEQSNAFEFPYSIESPQKNQFAETQNFECPNCENYLKKIFLLGLENERLKQCNKTDKFKKSNVSGSFNEAEHANIDSLFKFNDSKLRRSSNYFIDMETPAFKDTNDSSQVIRKEHPMHNFMGNVSNLNLNTVEEKFSSIVNLGQQMSSLFQESYNDLKIQLSSEYFSTEKLTKEKALQGLTVICKTQQIEDLLENMKELSSANEKLNQDLQESITSCDQKNQYIMQLLNQNTETIKETNTIKNLVAKKDQEINEQQKEITMKLSESNLSQNNERSLYLLKSKTPKEFTPNRETIDVCDNLIYKKLYNKNFNKQMTSPYEKNKGQSELTDSIDVTIEKDDDNLFDRMNVLENLCEKLTKENSELKSNVLRGRDSVTSNLNRTPSVSSMKLKNNFLNNLKPNVMNCQSFTNNSYHLQFNNSKDETTILPGTNNSTFCNSKDQTLLRHYSNDIETTPNKCYCETAELKTRYKDLKGKYKTKVKECENSNKEVFKLQDENNRILKEYSNSMSNSKNTTIKSPSTQNLFSNHLANSIHENPRFTNYDEEMNSLYVGINKMHNSCKIQPFNGISINKSNTKSVKMSNNLEQQPKNFLISNQESIYQNYNTNNQLDENLASKVNVMSFGKSIQEKKSTILNDNNGNINKISLKPFHKTPFNLYINTEKVENQTDMLLSKTSRSENNASASRFSFTKNELKETHENTMQNFTRKSSKGLELKFPKNSKKNIKEQQESMKKKLKIVEQYTSNYN